MAVSYRIAVIGDWESVMGFRALGLDTYPVASVEEAKEKVRELAKTDCAVIYLTEQLAKDMDDVLSRYKDELRQSIHDDEKRIGKLWSDLFHKEDRHTPKTPVQRMINMVNIGSGVLDGLILGWKLYRKFKGGRR